jgi:hypothetical protein
MRRAVLLLVPILAVAADRVDLNTTEKVDFAAGGTVRIEGSTGELNIEGWNQPTVEIQASRSTWEPKTDLKKIGVTKQLNGNSLTITTTHKRFTDAQVDYRIRVPRNTNLVIHHGIGAVTVFDVTGNIDATAKDGDMVVQLPEPAKYQIDATTWFGGIYTDFSSAHHPHLALGESLHAAPEGTGDLHQIHLHVGTGGITIQKAPAAALLSLN